MKKIISLLILLLPTLLFANQVMVVEIDGGIGPGSASYIQSSIDNATEEGMEALIIILDTPGGLLESTRDIVSSIMEAEVPVVVYVGPSGARAGSAGVFITLSANIAVMAPGTNIGAAHPVGIGGESDTTDMFKKVTNDAAAFIRTIAQRRGKNQDWAERAVRESISATENEALSEGIIDFVAPGIDSLLKAIHGMEVTTKSRTMTLETANAKIVVKDMDWREKLLFMLSDPNLAYIFIMLAIYGIMFELWNPGAIFPGVIGAIAAILAAFSLQMLPVNYVGVALIIISVVLFILEIKIASFGLLTIGGIVTFILGSTMLIDSPFEFMNISLGIIITASLLTAAFFLFVIGMGLKAQTRKKTGGKEGLINETGIAINNIEAGNKGNIKIHGEIWSAISDYNIDEGSRIVVTGIDGLTLKIKPFENPQINKGDES